MSNRTDFEELAREVPRGYVMPSGQVYLLASDGKYYPKEQMGGAIMDASTLAGAVMRAQDLGSSLAADVAAGMIDKHSAASAVAVVNNCGKFRNAACTDCVARAIDAAAKRSIPPAIPVEGESPEGGR